MRKQINNIINTRKYLLDVVKELSIESLNEIPEGFNNNIVWHLGHIVAAQQGVCYMRAGLKPFIDESLIKQFLPGTKPERFYKSFEVQNLKEVMFSSLDQLEADVNNNLFSNYNKWTTRYGVELSNINEAIEFIAFHEGYHSGFIIALKRTIK